MGSERGCRGPTARGSAGSGPTASGPNGVRAFRRGGRVASVPPAVLVGAVLTGTVLAVSIPAACVGPRDLRTEPLDAGKSLSIERAMEAVLPVARRAVLEEGFDIRSETVPDDTTRVLYGRRVLTEREVATDLRVVVREVGNGATVVRVLARRAVPTEIRLGGDYYVDRILRAIANRFLEPVPEGGGGPPSAPPAAADAPEAGRRQGGGGL